jgi:hypothetical protein
MDSGCRMQDKGIRDLEDRRTRTRKTRIGGRNEVTIIYHLSFYASCVVSDLPQSFLKLLSHEFIIAYDIHLEKNSPRSNTP